MAFGGGPMKAMPASSSACSEGSPLRQEAVAGVHGFRAGRLARVDDQLGLEVGFRRRRRPQAYGLVGHLHMRRANVGIGINRDGLDAHAPRSADHPARNLPAICDQDFLEHQTRSRRLRSSQLITTNTARPMASSGNPTERFAATHGSIGSAQSPMLKRPTETSTVGIQSDVNTSAARRFRWITPPPHPAAGGCGQAGAAPHPQRRRGSCRGRRSPELPRPGARHNPAAG